jgi:hypothetical protein
MIDDELPGELPMDFNRNHYFIAGILLLLAGVQFRYVTSFELNERTSQFVDRRFGKPSSSPQRSLLSFGNPAAGPNLRVVHPPRWLGWSFMSIGGVLFCFSLTMQRPGA